MVAIGKKKCVCLYCICFCGKILKKNQSTWPLKEHGGLVWTCLRVVKILLIKRYEPNQLKIQRVIPRGILRTPCSLSAGWDSSAAVSSRHRGIFCRIGACSYHFLQTDRKPDPAAPQTSVLILLFHQKKTKKTPKTCWSFLYPLQNVKPLWLPLWKGLARSFRFPSHRVWSHKGCSVTLSQRWGGTQKWQRALCWRPFLGSGAVGVPPRRLSGMLSACAEGSSDIRSVPAHLAVSRNARRERRAGRRVAAEAVLRASRWSKQARSAWLFLFELWRRGR